MSRFIFLAHTNAIDGKEDQFNRWYDEQHIPDVLGTPGFVAAQRFRASDDQLRPGATSHRYLTVYEIEAKSVAEAIEKFRQRAGSGAIRMSDSVDATAATMAFYEPVGPRVASE